MMLKIFIVLRRTFIEENFERIEAIVGRLQNEMKFTLTAVKLFRRFALGFERNTTHS